MTDYKQLCAELFNELHAYKIGNPSHDTDLIDRARAALAEPKPEGLADQELLEVLDRATADFPPNHPEAEPMTGARYALTLELRKARAAIAADRARRPAPQPPEDGQVAELVNHARSSNTQAVALAVALEQLADAADEYGPAGGADGKALSEAVKRTRKTLNRAADLLERLKELEQVNSQPS